MSPTHASEAVALGPYASASELPPGSYAFVQFPDSKPQSVLYASRTVAGAGFLVMRTLEDGFLRRAIAFNPTAIRCMVPCSAQQAWDAQDGRPDGTSDEPTFILEITPRYPTPEALAADPPPFQFLPPSRGHYWLLKTRTDGTAVKCPYPAERMQSRPYLSTQFGRNYSWISRHFGIPRTMTWPDGLTEPVAPDIDWKAFGLWIRDMCRAVPAGSEPATAMDLAASGSSPGIAPEGGRTAPSDPPDHRDVRRDCHPHPGSDQPATCHDQSGTTSPPASPPTGSMPPSPDRTVPARDLPSAALLARADTGSVPGLSRSGLEPSSSPSVVRTNDGEAASPSAQADRDADAERLFVLRWSTAGERKVGQYHFIGPFHAVKAASAWATDPANNPDESPRWQVLRLRPDQLRVAPPVFSPDVADRPSAGDFA